MASRKSDNFPSPGTQISKFKITGAPSLNRLKNAPNRRILQPSPPTGSPKINPKSGPGAIFILEKASLEVAKVGKTYQLLNYDDHSNFLWKNKKDPALYMPDIVHQVSKLWCAWIIHALANFASHQGVAKGSKKMVQQAPPKSQIRLRSYGGLQFLVTPIGSRGCHGYGGSL
ncbi:hypothetical protein FF1_012501 [Malus domestica]